MQYVTNWNALVSFTRYNKYWSDRSENPEPALVPVGTTIMHGQHKIVPYFIKTFQADE